MKRSASNHLTLTEASSSGASSSHRAAEFEMTYSWDEHSANGVLQKLEEIRCQRSIQDSIWQQYLSVYDVNGSRMDFRSVVFWPMDFPLRIVFSPPLDILDTELTLENAPEEPNETASFPRLQAHSSDPEPVYVMLIEFTRSNWEYEEVLKSEPALRECLADLANHDHNINFGRDEPKVFLEPHLVERTKIRLSQNPAILKNEPVYWENLKARHVVASSAYHAAVKNAVRRLRAKSDVRVRDETAVVLSGSSNSASTGHLSLGEPVEVRRSNGEWSPATVVKIEESTVFAKGDFGLKPVKNYMNEWGTYIRRPLQAATPREETPAGEISFLAERAAAEKARANMRHLGVISSGDSEFEVRVHETMIHVDVPSNSVYSGTSAGHKAWSEPGAPNKRSRKLKYPPDATSPMKNPSQSLGGCTMSLSPGVARQLGNLRVDFEA